MRWHARFIPFSKSAVNLFLDFLKKSPAGLHLSGTPAERARGRNRMPVKSQ
jgi:hypothetical protein